MDVVGSIGYKGQRLFFIDSERFGYVTGKSICIYDTAKGPRDMIWRTDYGISQTAVCKSTGSMAIVSTVPAGHLEIVDLSNYTTKTILKNPTRAALIEVAFLKQGDKVYGLTDLTDHRIILWSVSNAENLIEGKLEVIYKACCVNPCDGNQVCLYGDEGLAFGLVSEALGIHTINIVRIDLARANSVEDEERLISNQINFVLWLPRNRVIVGNSDGLIFSVIVEGCRSVLLGQFSIAERISDSSNVKKTERLTALCAVLSSNCVIVGAKNGSVYWYATANLMEETSAEAPILDLGTPLQVAHLGSENPVASIALDENFMVLLAGTVKGDISKLPLQLSDESSADQAELFRSGAGEDYDEAALSFAKKATVVVGTLLGSDSKSGIVLCAESVSIGVHKFSGRSRSSLSMLVTGSHTGLLKFWRQTAQVVDPMSAAGGGIRRSAPRAMKCIFEIAAGESGVPSVASDRAVCSMAFVALPNKNSTLCAVGLASGVLELWGLEAFEQQEEEDRGENEGDGVLVEDDEGACIVRVSIRRIYCSRVFREATSLMAILSSPSFNDSRNVTLAIGSHGSSSVYLMNILRSDQLEQCQISQHLVLDVADLPQSLIWTNDTLLVMCASGCLLGFDSAIIHSTSTAPASSAAELLVGGVSCKTRLTPAGLDAPTMALVSPTNSDLLVVLSSGSNVVHTFSVRSVAGGGTPAGTAVASQQLGDFPVCASFSPSGRYFAVGSLDGSVYVWKVSLDESGIALVNKMQLHSAAVVSLTFSVCSSLLLSNAVDGSCFVSTLDKPSAARNAGAGLSSMATKSNLFQEETPGALTVLTSQKQQQDLGDDEAFTWLELRQKEYTRDLKARQKFKSMGISAAVGEIAQRLAVLVTQNSERTELEQLPRSAFVIDVRHMQDIERARKERVVAVERMYNQRNAYNEALASRSRFKCWDSTEAASVGYVLPFALPLTSTLSAARAAALSSYAIPRQSPGEEELISKIKRMRVIEIRSQRSSTMGSVQRIPGQSCYRIGWNVAVKGCPPALSWIANDGTRWPVHANLDALLAGEKALPAGSLDSKETPSKDQQPAVNDEDDDENSLSADEDREIDEDSALNLLYAPESVRTPVQKRNQAVFLREIIRQIKSKFNERWLQVFREKEDIIGAIQSRNVRIRAILEDLRVQDNSLVDPRLWNLEVPRSGVEVAEEEMSSGRYESAAKRAVRAREEEERLRRESLKDGEDIKGRALNEMMNGTLEVKRDVFAEASALVRPEWMDILAVADMTEAQLREYDLYQQKLKSLQEEQTIYRKSLEQEVKKLRAEIADSCKAFDERLEELARLKVLVSREILSQELYVARLGLNMARIDQNRSIFRKADLQLQQLRKERNDVRANVDRLSSKADEMRHRIAAVEEECRQMDKGFKRDLQNLCNNTFDQDKLKVFTQLYRQRQYPRTYYDVSAAGENYGEQSEVDASASVSQKRGRSSSKGGKHSRSQKKSGLSGSNANEAAKNRTKMKASRNVSTGGKDGSSLGPMQQAAQALRASDEAADKNAREKDPYYEAQLMEEKRKLILESQIPLLTPLNMELDCPEGFDVDQFYWSKLQELRNARIEREIEGKLLAIEFAEFRQKQELAELTEQAGRTSISEMKALRESASASLAVLASDLDLVVCLRQGQDEVDREAVVTDYGRSLLLPVEVVHKYNVRIKDLGREKIGVLSKIKQFRRKINLIDWEAAHHGLEAQHYECYLTDLQLFRVTRELQKIIRDVQDGTDGVKDKVDRVAVRKEFMLRDSEAKLVQLAKGNDALARQLDDRNTECSVLAEKIASLKSTVAASKSVKQSRDESRGGAGELSSAAATKMKKVVGRRRLVDTARAQAEEIDFLRQELDRMRQRTFPSFVRSTKKRITVHPDGV